MPPKFDYTNVTLVEDGQGLDGEILEMGPLTIRILEDGRNTDNRLGSMLLTIKPGVKGPPIHWHRMHDETFFVTKGKIRFTVIPAEDGKMAKETKEIDTKAGDYVIVPTKSIHTFSNPFDEPAEFFNTFTPAYYVDYLRMLAKAINKAQKEGGRMLNEEEQRGVMAQFATFEPGDVGVEL